MPKRYANRNEWLDQCFVKDFPDAPHERFHGLPYERVVLFRRDQVDRQRGLVLAQLHFQSLCDELVVTGQMPDRCEARFADCGHLAEHPSTGAGRHRLRNA